MIRGKGVFREISSVGFDVKEAELVDIMGGALSK